MSGDLTRVCQCMYSSGCKSEFMDSLHQPLKDKIVMDKRTERAESNKRMKGISILTVFGVILVFLEITDT